MRIITDTTVWYNGLDDPKWQGLYTATHINFGELAFSHKIHKDFKRWKRAITNLRDVPTHYLHSEPQQFLLYGGDERAEGNGKVVLQPVFKFFRGVIDHDTEFNFTPEIKYIIDKENEKYKQIRDLMQRIIRDSQRSERMGSGKRISVEEARLYFRQVFCQAFMSDQILDIDHSQVDWSEFELLEKTGAQFFHELQTGKRGYVENDYFDLCNLMYVSPRDKYFVIEKKWKELIRDAGMGHYIYEPIINIKVV